VNYAWKVGPIDGEPALEPLRIDVRRGLEERGGEGADDIGGAPDVGDAGVDVADGW
jgi:hypothetical protein